jgi:hypothetical protein
MGAYDFNAPANQDVPIMLIRKNSLYLIERYSFSTTSAESDFLGAVITVPTLSVKIPSETNRQIYPLPIPLVNYIDGLETLIYVYSNEEQNITGSMQGQIAQSLPFVGVPSIIAQVQFNIYEVKNKDWIDHFLGRTKGGQAVGLAVAGGTR